MMSGLGRIGLDVNTYVAFATAAAAASSAALHTETWALSLNVAYSSAGVALFGGRSARGGARGRLMSRLATIVAKTLVRRTIFRDMTH